MTRSAEALRQLAHALHAHEPVVEKRSVGSVFEKLQREQIVRIRIESLSLDSTSIKVHPDGTGALKKQTAGHRQIVRRMEHQGSSGFRGCSNGHKFPPLARQRTRCARGSRSAGAIACDAKRPADAHGSRLSRQSNAAIGARTRDGPGRAAQVQPHRALAI